MAPSPSIPASPMPWRWGPIRWRISRTRSRSALSVASVASSMSMRACCHRPAPMGSTAASSIRPRKRRVEHHSDHHQHWRHRHEHPDIGNLQTDVTDNTTNIAANTFDITTIFKAPALSIMPSIRPALTPRPRAIRRSRWAPTRRLRPTIPWPWAPAVSPILPIPSRSAPRAAQTNRQCFRRHRRVRQHRWRQWWPALFLCQFDGGRCHPVFRRQFHRHRGQRHRHRRHRDGSEQHLGRNAKHSGRRGAAPSGPATSPSAPRPR